MSDFDHEHVSHLLNIVAQCAGHSGKLGAISNEAMHELLELNAKMHVQGTERRKRADADEAQRKAVEAKRVQDETEANDKAQYDASNRGHRRVGPTVIEPTRVDPIEATEEEHEEVEAEDGSFVRPTAFPSDSNTATIADANIDRRL
jgi:hypothetical protein